ncbi:MAG: tetratricopeptide repeat protein, partial [Myxococcota bacterium]
MAPRLNKRKTLEAATKHAQRGAFDKALKEYQKLLKVDPHDSHVRLRIGDLFLRRKQPDLAVEAYEQAAGQLVQKGFDAKAAAIYKQVLRIKPEHVEAHARLGEVHQRQGLAADALREFETAAELYRKRGAKHEAFELLRRVASLDPQNFANRLGLADLLFREGLTEEASEECHALLRDVQADDEPEELVRIAEQMLTHLPEDPQVVSAFSAGKVRCGAAGEGVAQLTSLAAEHPESVSVREALIECHEALGARAEVQALWGEIAELYKQRGDTDRAREILQRHVSLDPLDEEEQTPPSIDLLEEVVDTQENLGLDSRAAEPLDVSTVSEIELDHEAVETGDVGDLLAEARVALEFGDLEDAERRARAVLELDPTLDDARGVLAEACARLGRLDEAIELTTQRRDLAASAGDGDHLSQIEAKLLEYQNQQSARVETPTGLPDIEIELVSDGDRDSRAASVDPPPELREAVRRPHRKKPAPARPTDPTGRSPDAAEDLSEAQFFVEQGLLDEAERILEGVL